jgi:hypothetical protein
VHDFRDGFVVAEAGTGAPHSRLEEYERDSNTRPPYILTRTEVKLLGIAGVSENILSSLSVLCADV